MRGALLLGGVKTAGLASVVALSALSPPPASAQATEDNAATQSGDAFGRAVGSERIGLYSPDEVRGFSPVDAGNVRIEGLYFDYIDRISPRLVDGNTIRVGIAAQRYPFPAPTGLVDYALEHPEPGWASSLELDTAGAQGIAGPGAALSVSAPLAGNTLALRLAAGGRNVSRVEGGNQKVRNMAAVLAWHPSSNAEIKLFGSLFRIRSDEARATYFPAGNAPPPQMERRRFLGQPWTTRDQDTFVHGAIARLPIGGFALEAGLFYDGRRAARQFADLVLGVTPDGITANRVVIADGGIDDHSVSGEVRLTREWRSGKLEHRVISSIRGRERNRLFGGSRRLTLGPSSAVVEDFRPEPAYALGAKSTDHVSQLTGGLGYNLLWPNRATLDVGLSWGSYRKALDFADPLLADPVTRDHPLTWNVSGTVTLARNIYLYGGLARGQEDALLAPDIAVNRSEAPPAIRSRQVEAGVRAGLTKDLTLVAGLFSISKPYFNLDPALRYRQLGDLTNRGVELSLTGKVAPGLTVVAGGVLLDPRIAGEAVDNGLIGIRPVGQPRQRGIVNLDWRTGGGKGDWSFDMAFEAQSSRMGNAANSFSVAPRATINLGARYRFKIGKTHLLFRPQIYNLFDNYSWQVSPSGGFTYTAARTVALQIAADF